MLGKPVPDFSLPSTGSVPFRLCDLRGISRDSLSSHRRFKEKMRFPFELLSDPDEAVCEQFGVMKLKVPGHAQEVLNFVKAL